MHREVIRYHDLTHAQRVCQNLLLNVRFADLTSGRALHGQGGSHPLNTILASKVVLLPRLRGAEQRTLSPHGAQAYKGESEVLAPISSTEKSRRVSIFSAIITR